MTIPKTLRAIEQQYDSQDWLESLRAFRLLDEAPLDRFPIFDAHDC